MTFYHKSYTISGSTKIIYRYLPKEIGELAIYYIWLVLPFLSRISFQIFKRPLSDYLFQNLLSKNRKITSDRLRTLLRRETLAGLGISINPSDYRHISIGISRRYLSKPLQFQSEDILDEYENENEYEDDILDIQAAHNFRTASTVYARGLFELSGEIQTEKRRFQEASLVSLFYLYFLLYIFYIYFIKKCNFYNIRYIY